MTVLSGTAKNQDYVIVEQLSASPTPSSLILPSLTIDFYFMLIVSDSAYRSRRTRPTCMKCEYKSLPESCYNDRRIIQKILKSSNVSISAFYLLSLQHQQTNKTKREQTKLVYETKKT